MKRINLLRIGLGSLVLFILLGNAFAGTATSNIPVSAAVNSNCTISTTQNLAFGSYDPVSANDTTPLNATGIVSVKCTKGATGLAIGLGDGNNVQTGQRYFDAGHTFAYNIYKPDSNTPSAACTAYSTAWGNTLGTDTFSISNSTSKAARTYNVCGQIPASQDVATGSYNDTIVATVNF